VDATRDLAYDLEIDRPTRLVLAVTGAS
jgi:hypothetical protein